MPLLLSAPASMPATGFCPLCTPRSVYRLETTDIKDMGSEWGGGGGGQEAEKEKTVNPSQKQVSHIWPAADR